MMAYKSNQKYRSTFGFVDLLFNLLIGFVFLFVIAFLLINPVAKTKAIDPKAEFLIKMSWPDFDHNDIDLWVRSPSGIVSFVVLDNETMHLDRDDLGNTNDSLVVDGVKLENPINSEAVSIRQSIEGEYNINIHWYLKKGTYGAAPLDEVPVKVEIIKINPYKVVANRTIILTKEGQEQTAFNFTMKENNFADDVNTNQEFWVLESINKTRNIQPPGAP